jgi:hypothetical protein
LLREGPLLEFEANSHKYNYGYFLIDGIYPRWQTFVKPVHQPKCKKQTQFHNAQAAVGKYVKRAFGILQAQFATVRGPARFRDQEFFLIYIINACIIMHTMIIEDDRGKDIDHTHYDLMRVSVQVRRSQYRMAHFDTHDELKKYLMEEWSKWNGQQ